MKTMNTFLKSFIPVAEAASALLAPHGEVVIHDLVSDRIFYICGNYSGRSAGDESLLGNTISEADSNQVYPPYPKSGPAGEPLRCVSAVISDEHDKPRGLFCINVDISEMEQARKILSGFMASPFEENPPKELFEFDWREQINVTLYNFLKDRRKKLKNLTRAERCEFTLMLKKKGLLEARRSIAHLAKSLNVTRATIYNYLNKTSKENANEPS